MKTLLSRSITAPAAIIAVTLATPTVAKEADIESLVASAEKEGAVYSVGMPDSWANWKDPWSDLKLNYSRKLQDTVMS
ncbi:ABC transporter substrate-binding protein, partial [Escherichia coli]|nr:ABC transporter substrate-binding protein [Escherichia coli]